MAHIWKLPSKAAPTRPRARKRWEENKTRTATTVSTWPKKRKPNCHGALIWRTVSQNDWMSNLQISYYYVFVPNHFKVGNFDGGTCMCGVVLKCQHNCGFDQWSSATAMFHFAESRGNCCERERCGTRMVGVYSVSRRRWDVNFGHRLSCTGPLEGVFRQRKKPVWQEGSFPTLCRHFRMAAVVNNLRLSAHPRRTHREFEPTQL